MYIELFDSVGFRLYLGAQASAGIVLLIFHIWGHNENKAMLQSNT